MLLVIPACRTDIHLAIKQLQVIKKLDSRVSHSCLLALPTNVPKEEHQKLTELANGVFQSVSTFTYSDWAGGNAWPLGANWAFQETARHLSATRNTDPWFWLEPDAVPLRPGWLDQIADAYTLGGKLYAGHIVGSSHMNGVGIYPPFLDRHATRVFIARQQAFDITLSQEVGLQNILNLNHLISHRMKVNRVGTSFKSKEDVEQLLATGAVVFHGCEDGSLHDHMLGEVMQDQVGLMQTLMRWKYGKGKWTISKAAHKVVSLVIRSHEPRIIHCLERHKQKDSDATRRVMQASASWDALYQTKRLRPAHVWNYPRNSEQIGDARCLPYLKDILLAGLNGGSRSDLVLWTNDDTILHRGIPDIVIPETCKRGAVSSFRVNFDKDNIPPLDLPVGEIIIRARQLKPPGDIDLGRDLFCFTKPWLREHWHEIPDMLLGELEFDLVLAYLIRKHAGVHTTKLNMAEIVSACELPRGYVLHERHNRLWTNRSQEAAAGKVWNRKLATEFYADNGLHSLITTKL